MWKIVKVKNGANIDAKGKNLAEKFIEKMTCFTYRDQLHLQLVPSNVFSLTLAVTSLYDQDLQ